MLKTEARNRALWNALPRDVKGCIEDAVSNGKMEVVIELTQLGYSESQREDAIESLHSLGYTTIHHFVDRDIIISWANE